MKRIILTLVCVSMWPSQLWGQTDMIKIFTSLITQGQDTIINVPNDVEIIPNDSISPMFDEGIDFYLKQKFKDLEIINNRIVIKKMLVLRGIPKDKLTYWFKGFHFTKPVIIDNPDDEYRGIIILNNCIFEKGLFFQGNFFNAVIMNSKIDNYFFWNSKKGNAFAIDSTQFNFNSAYKQIPSIIGQREFMWQDAGIDTLNKYIRQAVREDFQLSVEIIDKLQITNSSFVSNSKYTSIGSILTKECHDFSYYGNQLNQLLNLNNLVVTNSIVIADNIINGYVSLSTIELPPFTYKIKIFWNQLEGHKLAILEKKQTGGLGLKLDAIYTASTPQELDNSNVFIELTGAYQSLLNIYKANGDLVSTNGCFAELKDLQGMRLKNIYVNQGGFKNYFSWKINKLLKIYTNHGTDPALAVTFSFYVILFFGIVFFFFPSDWDVTSKSQLVQNFREFINKNDKGYVKPFFKVLLGFSLSLTNAVTLSINAFTTLGFGNIPTHGLARYLCIIEGFIGWFLLSIFTVALINQVSI